MARKMPLVRSANLNFAQYASNYVIQPFSFSRMGCQRGVHVVHVGLGNGPARCQSVTGHGTAAALDSGAHADGSRLFAALLVVD
jgi:hypothetical protein